MVTVGIIANPAAGKDVRRVVAHGQVISNVEKTTMVRRMLVGLHAAGVFDTRIMPDRFGIGDRAVRDLAHRQPHIVSGVNMMDMDCTGTGADTMRAAQLLCQMGASCILTLGGDGTVRLAARGCEREVPLLPVSTGTNNVLPRCVEATIAGLAAGIVAQQDEPGRQKLCARHKQIDIMVNGLAVDIALVDAVAIAGSFTGTRAVWEAGHIRQIAVAQASPTNIGFSAIVGLLQPISVFDRFGVVVWTAADGNARTVLAPLGPGLMDGTTIGKVAPLEPDRPCPVVAERPLVLALDGEREIVLRDGDEAAFVLRTDGPWVVEVERAMAHAVTSGYFVSSAAESPIDTVD